MKIRFRTLKRRQRPHVLRKVGRKTTNSRPSILQLSLGVKIFDLWQQLRQELLPLLGILQMRGGRDEISISVYAILNEPQLAA